MEGGHRRWHLKGKLVMANGDDREGLVIREVPKDRLKADETDAIAVEIQILEAGDHGERLRGASGCGCI